MGGGPGRRRDRPPAGPGRAPFLAGSTEPPGPGPPAIHGRPTPSGPPIQIGMDRCPHRPHPYDDRRRIENSMLQGTVVESQSMNISVKQENLARGLGIVSRAVANRATLPVLANVLLRTEDGGLKLTATNLEIGITCWVPGKVEDGGEITVPARLLTDLVGSLPQRPHRARALGQGPQPEGHLQGQPRLDQGHRGRRVPGGRRDRRGADHRGRRPGPARGPGRGGVRGRDR